MGSAAPVASTGGAWVAGPAGLGDVSSVGSLVGSSQVVVEVLDDVVLVLDVGRGDVVVVTVRVTVLGDADVVGEVVSVTTTGTDSVGGSVSWCPRTNRVTGTAIRAAATNQALRKNTIACPGLAGDTCTEDDSFITSSMRRSPSSGCSGSQVPDQQAGSASSGVTKAPET